MKNLILRYGRIAGLVVGVPLSLMTILYKGHTDSIWGMVVGYLTMLIALSAVFVAIKRYRDTDLGGVITFWPAFGLGISVVAGIFYVAAWEAACAIAHLDFGTAYANAIIAEAKAKGVTGAALDQVIAQMNQFKANYANPLYRWPMTFIEIFPVGVLVSIISAALLQNRRFMPVQRA